MRACAVVLFSLTETFTNHDPTGVSRPEFNIILCNSAAQHKLKNIRGGSTPRSHCGSYAYVMEENPAYGTTDGH